MPRDLRWVAQYADGRIVREFAYAGPPELGRLRETPWWNVDLSRVISIGLEGSNLRVGYRLDDGVIGVNGKGLRVALVATDGRVFPVTGPRMPYRRVIQYKEAWSALGRDGQKDAIESYNVGWEASGQDDLLGDWWCKMVARVPSADGEPVQVFLHMRVSAGFTGQTLALFGDTRLPPIGTVFRPGTENRMMFRLAA